MAAFDAELLKAARQLLTRRSGQKGKLPSARVRRSISTSYYALFHFLIEEAGKKLIGSQNDLRRRRRVFARSFTHKGVKLALDKVRGANVDQSVVDFLEASIHPRVSVPSPRFVRGMAAAFLDAQAKREIADYDLNESLSEQDARLLYTRVRRAIANWRAANTAADRDFKHALCMLMLLRGKLKPEP